MQRHFSNRGEALAEVAAAKMMAHRTALPRPVFPNLCGKGVTPGQWKPRVTESIHPTNSPKKRETRERGKSGVGLPEF